MITKGKFADGHEGWKVLEKPENKEMSIPKGYEIIYTDDDECVTDHVYTEEDANLIASAPTMYNLLREWAWIADRIAMVEGDHQQTLANLKVYTKDLLDEIKQL